MRSIMSFAALVAAVGFSGCCGTGGSCPLSAHGCKLGGLGKKAATATAVESFGDSGGYVDAGDCGCDGAAYSDQGMMHYTPVEGDCGCGALDSAGAAACACGPDAVVSVSAPYDCESGQCGQGLEAAMPAGDGDCGCSSCVGDAPVVSPMQLSAPAGSGCSACEGASVQTPAGARGFLSGRGMGNGTDGLGMTMTDRGIACNDGGPQGCAARKNARALKPKRTKKTLAEKFGFAKSEVAVEEPAEIELVSNEFESECVECDGGAAGRHISHGFISDVRGVHQGHFGGKHAGCGRGGCGHGGRLCGGCNKLRNVAGIGSGNPYGGVIPHTAQAPGQSGMAPSYAYPYYTTRGPRDFLRDNPPSIGR